MTAPSCSHLDLIDEAASPSGDGCVECLAVGSTWVHLRRCATCGHIGCCDSSPMRHATAHAADGTHPLVQSFEPGEDWIWCYVDEVALEIATMLDSPSHP